MPLLWLTGPLYKRSMKHAHQGSNGCATVLASVRRDFPFHSIVVETNGMSFPAQSPWGSRPCALCDARFNKLTSSAGMDFIPLTYTETHDQTHESINNKRIT